MVFNEKIKPDYNQTYAYICGDNPDKISVTSNMKAVIPFLTPNFKPNSSPKIKTKKLSISNIVNDSSCKPRKKATVETKNYLDIHVSQHNISKLFVSVGYRLDYVIINNNTNMSYGTNFIADYGR